MPASRVLDTSLLFESALIRFTDQAPEPLKSLRWTARILTKEEAVDRLETIARQCRVVTTHLVLAEVGRLAQRLVWPKDVAGDHSPTWPFLDALREVMAELKLEVHSLPIQPVRHHLRRSFGPTDADLVAVTLLLSKAPGGAALLTADQDLALWCRGNGVPCDHFEPHTPPSG